MKKITDLQDISGGMNLDLQDSVFIISGLGVVFATAILIHSVYQAKREEAFLTEPSATLGDDPMKRLEASLKEMQLSLSDLKALHPLPSLFDAGLFI